MNKAKISFTSRIAHLFTYHPWLKIISLGLAIIVWFFVTGEIAKLNN